MNRTIRIGCVAAAVALVCSVPANGQAWIGQVVGHMAAQQQAAAQEAACMNGQPMPADEIAEALAPADALMRTYFTAMHDGSAPRSSFFALDGKARFTALGKSVDRAAIDQLAEPLLGTAPALDAEPLGFVRSGLDATALGQWAVRDAQGRVAGIYTGFFVRKLGEWKLRTLTVEASNEYAGPVEQFCHAPGDVLPHRLATGQRLVEWRGKRLAKAEAKAARLAEAAAKAGDKAAASGRQTADDQAKLAREQVESWAAEVAERRAALEQARDELAAARAEAAAAAERKVRARAALGLT